MQFLDLGWTISQDRQSILKSMWDERYQIAIGNVAMVSSGNTVGIMRLSEHEFCVIVTSSMRDFNNSFDIVRGVTETP